MKREEQRNGEGEGEKMGRGGVGRREVRGAELRTGEAAGKGDSGNILLCVGTVSHGLEYNYERMTLGACFISGKFTLT